MSYASVKNGLSAGKTGGKIEGIERRKPTNRSGNFEPYLPA
jgi:hypothetical protein